MPEPAPNLVVAVVTDGGTLHREALAAVPNDVVVVAADSGVDSARAGGLVVHHAVGDFDSVSQTGLSAVKAAGGVLHPYPPDKDQTDFELALAFAVSLDPLRLVVLGGDQGRLDHLLANVLVLASPELASVEFEAWFGPTRVRLARPGRAVTIGGLGRTFSLLPLGGPARGVSARGARWSLADEDLEFGVTRGVSNEVVDDTAMVEIAAGMLAVIEPG